MTPNEFKVKYPQYAHLEGDALWDKMTEFLFLQGEVLTADPNQIKVYHEPILLANGVSISIEDESTTRWLNSKGEVVKLKPEVNNEKATTSYSMVILDMSKL